MKPNKENMNFLKPLLGLLLLCFSVSFQPYASGSVPAIALSEWVGKELASKKGKTASFSAIFSGATSGKYTYTASDFLVMLQSQQKEFELRQSLQNFDYSNYKITLQKCHFRAAIKISSEVPLFSEPV